MVCLSEVNACQRSMQFKLDEWLTFDAHANAMVRASNLHTKVFRHVQLLLTSSTATTLACSLINSCLDYCKALLHGVPETQDKKFKDRRVIIAAIAALDPNTLFSAIWNTLSRNFVNGESQGFWFVVMDNLL